MMSTRSRSQTLALAPNSFLKRPKVPGPHTSWVIRLSACTQTLSFGATLSFPAARARIFSVKVMGGAFVEAPSAPAAARRLGAASLENRGEVEGTGGTKALHNAKVAPNIVTIWAAGAML